MYFDVYYRPVCKAPSIEYTDAPITGAGRMLITSISRCQRLPTAGGYQLVVLTSNFAYVGLYYRHGHGDSGGSYINAPQAGTQRKQTT